MSKTIFALAAPIGGAIAIIRISGSSTYSIVSEIFTGKLCKGRLCFGKLVSGETEIDEIMAVYFAAPHSYTGEDMAELHIHGSRAVAKAASELLINCGAYPAQPGEFSLRAFRNGKMQLSQAEAVMDLINSSAERSAKSAMLQLSGALNTRIRAIQSDLTDILAQTDAIIDYPDEMEDADLLPKIRLVKEEIRSLSEHGARARYIREGIKIAIAGKPNVGKSSLLNALLYEDRAIVTHIAGTTRDIIEADTEMCNLPVHLYDTAGLHNTGDEVEKIGIERTRQALLNSDMCYVVLDISSEITEEDRAVLSETEGMRRIIVLNKTDIAVTEFSSEKDIVCRVSSKTGEGLDELKSITASSMCPDEESGIITNIRHLKALKAAYNALCDAENAPETDCMAQDVRMALHSLGLITGDEVDEDVLNRIFERFCVGK